MIKRPKPTDTEQEILAMQNEFLSEQSKNASFQPAAKLVKFDKCKDGIVCASNEWHFFLTIF